MSEERHDSCYTACADYVHLPRPQSRRLHALDGRRRATYFAADTFSVFDFYALLLAGPGAGRSAR